MIAGGYGLLKPPLDAVDPNQRCTAHAHLMVLGCCLHCLHCCLQVEGVEVPKTLLANSENTYAKLINERDEMIECLLGSFVPRSLFA